MPLGNDEDESGLQRSFSRAGIDAEKCQLKSPLGRSFCFYVLAIRLTMPTETEDFVDEEFLTDAEESVENTSSAEYEEREIGRASCRERV